MLSEKERIALLKTVSIFSELTDEERSSVAGFTREERFRKRRVIVKEGDEGDKLYIIVSGRAVVTKKSLKDRDNVVMALGPGECFGEMALIDEQPRSATVKALEDVTLLSIGKVNFRDMIRSHPDVALSIIKLFARRLRVATRLYTMM